MAYQSRSRNTLRWGGAAAISAGLLATSTLIVPSAFAKTVAHKATHHATVVKATTAVKKTTKKAAGSTITIGGAIGAAGGARGGRGDDGGRHAGFGGPRGHHGALIGSVTAVSSTSITISSPRGSSTFGVDPAVTVTKNGVADTITDVVVGERVGLTLSTTSANDVTAIAIAPAMLRGTVSSVGTGSFVITDDQGFSRTVTTTASTTYANAGAVATSSIVVVGAVVNVVGEVDTTDHTTLDATSVATGAPIMPAGAPIGPMAGADN